MAERSPSDDLLGPDVRAEFAAGDGYLNTASVGLPPRRATAALRDRIAEWERGEAEPPSYDADVDRARAAFATVAGTTVDRIGIVGQVSVATGLVAASLPDGARVLCAEEDFTSLLFPFLADRRLDVRLVPLAELVERVAAGVDLVAVSAVQSADGRVIDLDALAAAAAASSARTYLDVSQAAGWLPIRADRFDVTACGAYKWLCSPRGSGFITVAPHVDWLRPRYPGWYAGEDPWQALYGPPLRLAGDARRFGVSPAWLDFVGAARAIELLAEVGVDRIHDHSIGLAAACRARLGLPPANSAVVSLDTPHGPALAATGVRAAVRAGRVRLSFYVYNTMDDVDRVVAVLGAS